MSMHAKQAEQHPVEHVAKCCGLCSYSPLMDIFHSCLRVFWQITHSVGRTLARISAVVYACVAKENICPPGT
eukprot:547649-Rhodomonas_salina.1